MSVDAGDVKQRPLNTDGTIVQTWRQDSTGRIVLCYDTKTALGTAGGVPVGPNIQVALVPYASAPVWNAIDLSFQG